MNTIIIRYKDKGSVHYNEKEYRQGLSKVHREKKSPTGELQISESVPVKTKSRVWKAVVVDPEPSAAANSASQSSKKASSMG